MEELLNAIRLIPNLRIANSSVEHKVSLFPQALEYGKQGIDFLIECLQDAELEVRATAYELLQNIDSEAVRKEIVSGLLLNPGDRIYSVYQSAIWFTDDGYCLNDEKDYLAGIRIQIYRDGWIDEEDQRCQCERIVCYLNRETAEKTAEDLHKKLILENSIGGLGFEWEAKNSNFKQWCLDHQVDYDDNDLQYKRKVLDYLGLSENIDLLSKFWKDGVGNFAFVKEEFVQQKVYLKIGEKLTKGNTAVELFAKPQNYDTLAIDFLIKILEGDRSETKHKLKARQLLQNMESKYIPF